MSGPSKKPARWAVKKVLDHHFKFAMKDYISLKISFGIIIIKQNKIILGIAIMPYGPRLSGAGEILLRKIIFIASWNSAVSSVWVNEAACIQDTTLDPKSSRHSEFLLKHFHSQRQI